VVPAYRAGLVGDRQKHQAIADNFHFINIAVSWGFVAGQTGVRRIGY
jgi:hypothetical protein